MDEPARDPETPLPRRAALLLRIWDDGEAEMIRQILLGYGIPSRAESHVSHALFPLSVDGLGEIRIYVPEEHVEDAETILADHRRQGFEIVHEEAREDDGS